MRALRLTALLLLAALATGCAQLTLGAATPSEAGIQAARSSGIGASRLGDFKVAAGKPASLDGSLSLRGSPMGSPYDGSMSRYLQRTLEAELNAAGLLDPKSGIVISGELLDSSVDPAISEGKGRLAARFTVTREGRPAWSKELAVEASWPSSFVGAVAIPTAVNEYAALHRKLVLALLSDPDFRRAAAR